MKILMVCLGNICRSPLAEGIMRDKIEKAGLNWEVDSAGTGDWHIGNAPHELSQKVALQNDIDISGLRARQFVKEDLLNFELLYFMDESNLMNSKKIAGKLWDDTKCDLLLNELYPGEFKKVPDPYGYKFSKYEEVYEMLNLACDRVIEKYN